MKKVISGLVLVLVLALPVSGAARTSSSSSKTHSSSHTPSHVTKTKATKKTKVAKQATARCSDGTLSYSAHRSGMCSHHGGVAEWNPK